MKKNCLLDSIDYGSLEPQKCAWVINGVRCRNRAMVGEEYCKRHIFRQRGHNSWSGYGKWLKGAIGKVYHDSIKSPAKLLELYDEIALLRARIAQCVERLEDGESSEGWSAARAKLIELKSAVADGNSQAVSVALKRLDDILINGCKREAAWKDIYEAIGHRTRVTEAEADISIRTGEMLSRVQVRAVIAKLLSVVAEVVKDEGELVEIGRRIDQLALSAEPGALMAEKKVAEAAARSDEFV